MMMCTFRFSCVLLLTLFVFAGCKAQTAGNVESSGSDSTSASEHSSDTTTQQTHDTTDTSVDSATSPVSTETDSVTDSTVSTEEDSATSTASTETDSVTDSTPSTDEPSSESDSEKETDSLPSTDSATIGVESDIDGTDSSVIDTDVPGDTGSDTDTSTGTDVATDSATDTDTVSTTDSNDDTSSEGDSEPDSGIGKDSDTEAPVDCSAVGVNDFGDCETALGWATAGNHCAPISGCSCEPHCNHFFETEDACLVACFDLIPCGGPLGNPCADDQYCDFKTDENCGDDGATAICRIRQMGCEAIYWPVCGCDGNTYENDCEAGARGWGYRYEGPCNTPKFSI